MIRRTDPMIQIKHRDIRLLNMIRRTDPVIPGTLILRSDRIYQ